MNLQFLAFPNARDEKASTVSPWSCFMPNSSVRSTLAATEITACRFISFSTSVSDLLVILGSALSTLDLRSGLQQASK